jgi:hypothetical protein
MVGLQRARLSSAQIDAIEPELPYSAPIMLGSPYSAAKFELIGAAGKAVRRQ